MNLDDLVPVRLLGHGTLTEVLLVELPSKRVAALKRALAHHRQDPNVERLLRDEARVHAQFAHPSIPRLLHAAESENGFALLFEALDGVTLDEVLPKKSKLPLDAVTFIVHVIAGALEHAHERGVIHRDVGPHNIVITRSGDPVLIDFGIAVDDDRARWTATGALRGTLGYLSPEAVRGEPLDVRADVFALASTAFTLLTGQSAFGGKGARQILDAVASGRMRNEASLHPVFARALASQPEDRPPTPRAFALALGPMTDARNDLAARVAPHLQRQTTERTRTLT